MPKSRILALLTSLSLLVAVGGCITVNPPASPATPSPTLPAREHSTIYPKGNEISFKLKPNSSYSVVIYLQKNQWLKVNYLFSPTDLGGEVIHVAYTYPEGNSVTVAGNPGLRRDFETLTGHNEGYYSIDFEYLIPAATYDPDITVDIDVYVHWEIQG